MRNSKLANLLPIITFGRWFHLKYKCGFFSPITLIQSVQTNTQRTQQSSSNNIDYTTTLLAYSKDQKYLNKKNCIHTFSNSTKLL